MSNHSSDEHIRELLNRIATLESLVPRLTAQQAPADAGHPGLNVAVTPTQPAAPADGPAGAGFLRPVLERLDRIEATQHKLQHDITALLGGAVHLERTSYTIKEAAALLSRKPYTVREWCRLGRINYEREKTGRGGHGPYRISKKEIERIQNEGLLPEPRKR